MSAGPNNSQHRYTDPFNTSAYNNLFHELYVPLCRFSMKFVMNKNAAEDIVQDLFLYLWENWSRLAEIASLKSYVFTAVRNRSLSYLQKNFPKETTENRDAAKETIVQNGLPNPQELIECKELEHILEEALESLPAKCRTIFAMKRFGELSNKEVADELQLSIKTVEAQMTIAIRKLTAFVADHWQLILLVLLDRLFYFY
jgi:RNA polymerase sigma-70 factor, ECF subfamily